MNAKLPTGHVFGRHGGFMVAAKFINEKIPPLNQYAKNVTRYSPVSLAAATGDNARTRKVCCHILYTGSFYLDDGKNKDA